MEKSIREILALSGFSFKKKFGQNFITDKNLLDSIVALADADGKNVLEIGCGAGTLTRAIAARANSVIAYEVDATLKPVLEQTLSGVNNAEVVFRDFLKADLKALEAGLGEYIVIANLPYYITSQLIMKLIEESAKCTGITVMVQEEVAERLCAKAGTPEYGAITAAVALRADAKIVKRVPRTAFFPAPNVDSAVVNLKICDGRIKVNSAENYKKVVRAAFSSRRKTLVNNIMNAFSLNREQAENAVQKLGVNVKARGETLTPEQFALLSDILFN